MNHMQALQLLRTYQEKGLSLIPLKPRTKTPLVKWKEYRLTDEDFLKYLSQGINWAIRCDENFHAFDFDNLDNYRKYIQENSDILRGAPIVRTGRGYHVWFKPKTPVKSFNVDGIEVKGLGNLLVVPPSIHPSGAEYVFETPLNGSLPVIDVNELIGGRITGEPKEKKLSPPTPCRHQTLSTATTT
ncbi:MAG: bifunctional DNA primase/polymerase, partial [Dehalococcoidia bacterium]|nr:bifunctional DNA primase/polymerase [Dehalococcoidia bacterium]